MNRKLSRLVASKWFAFPLVAAPFLYLAWIYQQGAESPAQEINAPIPETRSLVPNGSLPPPDETNASLGEPRTGGPGESFSPDEQARLHALESELAPPLNDPLDLSSLNEKETNASSGSETDEAGLTVSDADFQAATNPDANPDAGNLLVLGEFFKDIGEIAIAFFIIVLCLTPLRRLFPRSLFVSALNKHRRLLGLSCFFYASLHLTFYFVDVGWSKFVKEWYLPYLLAGLVSFAVLLVMAATSNDWMVRRMGGRRWKNLHRFVYLLIPLLFYHKGWVGKAGWEAIRETLFWFSPLFALQAARVVVYFRKRYSYPAKAGGA